MAEKKKMSEKVDKRYRAKITIPGVSKPIYISAKTKRDLEDKRQETIERLITGQPLKDKAFVDVVKEWWENDREPNLKRIASVKNYRSIVNNNILPCFDERKLIRAVTIDDLQKCVNRLSDKSYDYVVHTVSTLRNIYAYAMSRNYVTTDVSLYIKRPICKDRKEKDFLTEDQTIRLLDIASKSEYGIFIYLCYYLGVRRGEALAMQWGDIDFKTNTVHVQRTLTDNDKISPGKTKASNRHIPVPTPLMTILKARRGMPGEYIIQNPTSKHEGHLMTSASMRWEWSLMLYHAGLARVSDSYIEKAKRYERDGKPPRKPEQSKDIILDFTPHWLRHNYVSMLYDAGVDAVTATRIVGHSSYQVTADIYTHISEMRKAKAALNLDHVFSKVAERLPGSASETTTETRNAL